MAGRRKPWKVSDPGTGEGGRNLWLIVNQRVTKVYNVTRLAHRSGSWSKTNVRFPLTVAVAVGVSKEK